MRRVKQKKEEENQNIEDKRYQMTEKKEGKVELILCIACIVDEKKKLGLLEVL
jgi:hypothetical protein